MLDSSLSLTPDCSLFQKLAPAPLISLTLPPASRHFCPNCPYLFILWISPRKEFFWMSVTFGCFPSSKKGTTDCNLLRLVLCLSLKGNVPVPGKERVSGGNWVGGETGKLSNMVALWESGHYCVINLFVGWRVKNFLHSLGLKSIGAEICWLKTPWSLHTKYTTAIGYTIK